MPPASINSFCWQDITAEEQRHAKQAAAMAAFHAEERGEAAAEFGKEAADAAVARMRKRLEKLKALQVRINTTGYGKLELRIPNFEVRCTASQLYTQKTRFKVEVVVLQLQ